LILFIIPKKNGINVILTKKVSNIKMDVRKRVKMSLKFKRGDNHE
jgi:hypothetical protein